MSPINPSLRAILSKVINTETQRSLVDEGLVESAQLMDGVATIVLNIPHHQQTDMDSIKRATEKMLATDPAIKKISVILTAEKPAAAPRPPAPGKLSLPHIKNILAVASGKGGVGKSTLATNLAVAFAQMGLRVGMLDADIYGPSQSLMLQVTGRPALDEQKKIIPAENYGIKIMSMALLAGDNAPMIWRGPMVQRAILQMINDVAWGTLDVLVMDLPPGTGDAQLTIAQQIPLTGAVIVSTPQDIALLDARKGLDMFTKMNIPVLGIIENMSYFCCPACGVQTNIFSHGGAQQTAAELNIPFLGAVPLTLALREKSDAGEPATLLPADHTLAAPFYAIAATLRQSLK